LWSDDRASWERLVTLYAPLVYQWCRRFGLQAEDAADVGQDVFQAVAGGINGFRHGGAGTTFRGWLWTVTRNKLVDHCRRQGGHARAVGGDAGLERVAEIPEDEPAWDDEPGDPIAGLVRRGVDLVRGEFEATTWNAFWLTAVEERAPAQVAGQLGLSVNAVYLARSRVLRRLREVLGEIA
jgi:RNA polymerase sigma-70 factor (ECF subfamily)